MEEIRLPEGIWPRRRDWKGVVASVLVEPGKQVRRGDVVAEVEIEKAVLAVESHVDGVVREVRVRPGDVVGPGDVLALVEAG